MYSNPKMNQPTGTNFITDTLLRQIASDNNDAFRYFYDIAYPVIYKFVHYFLPGKNDCEEVVSEVFYIIWKERKSLQSIQELKAWMYIVSRNEAFHFIKQKEKYRNLSIDEIPIELVIDPTSIDGKVLEKEMIAIYDAAVKTLPERCKLIFLMVREDRLKYKEIARILSITEGTVEKQMNIAIRKIVTIVKKHYPTLNYKK